MKTWNERIALAIEESEYGGRGGREQIAKLLNVSPPTVAAWVGAASIRPSKNITGENLLQVCELLNIRPEWLMFARGPMRPAKSDKTSPEMAALIDHLREIDSKGGIDREDALYFLNRLLSRESNMSVKQA